MATVVSYLCLMTVSADVAACHFLWQTLDIFMSSFDPAIKTPQLLPVCIMLNSLQRGPVQFPVHLSHIINNVYMHAHR